jgi:hypothetical protein
VSRKSSLEIVDVSLAERNPRQLANFHLDAPEPGVHQDTTSLTIVGWVIGQESRPVGVEVTSGNVTVAHAAVDTRRDGVAEAYRGVPGAEAAGFRLSIEGDGSGEDELQVATVLEDGSRVAIGTIRARIVRPRRFHRLRRG